MKAKYQTHWGIVEITGEKESICELMNYLADASFYLSKEYQCNFSAKYVWEIREQINKYYEKELEENEIPY